MSIHHAHVVRLAALVLLMSACHRTHTSNTTRPVSATTASDTARGIVRRVGPDPVSQLLLAPLPTASVSLSYALRSDSLALLTAAEGLEVVVRGQRMTERAMDVAPGGAAVFRVREFQVRAADGVEAHDGILRNDNGAFQLETRDGARHTIIDCPAALRTAVGARVFLVGPLTRAPQAFGILKR